MLPALISGAAAIGGGLINQASQDKFNDQQLAIANANINTQLKFAKEAIQWKVNDAKAAGIHPLYALGAQTQSFSPVSVGGSADSSLGEGIAKAGQNISRAVSSTADDELRSLTLSKAKLELERAGLENEVLRTDLASKIRLLTQPGSPPSVPIPVSRPIVDDDKFIPHFRFMGKTLLNSPMSSDIGSTMTNVLGEGAEYVMAIPKAAEIMGLNAIRNVLGLRSPDLAKQFERWLYKNYPINPKK